MKKAEYFLFVFLFTSNHMSSQFWMCIVLETVVCSTSHQHRKSTGCTVTPFIAGFVSRFFKHLL